MNTQAEPDSYYPRSFPAEVLRSVSPPPPARRTSRETRHVSHIFSSKGKVLVYFGSDTLQFCVSLSDTAREAPTGEQINSPGVLRDD